MDKDELMADAECSRSITKRGEISCYVTIDCEIETETVSGVIPLSHPVLFNVNFHYSNS